jgi:hypothetical protein
MAIELTKEECLHTILAVNAFQFADDCDTCKSVSKKLEAEAKRLYELPADIVLLEIPGAYKALGVTKWEKVIGKDDG